MKKLTLCVLTLAAASFTVGFYGISGNAAVNDEFVLTNIKADPAPTPVDPAWTAELLVEHNALRLKYNVPPLVWDDAIASSAQAWAERIALSGKTPPEYRNSESLGENIDWGSSGEFTAQFLVNRWGNEVSKYDLDTHTCTPENACFHFTQIVWSKTTKLGCGKAATSDGKTDFVVCHYSPIGNIRGQKPFQRLIPRSARLGVTNDDIIMPASDYNDNVPIVPATQKPTPTPSPTPARPRRSR
ncbi:MAG: CAP family protein [Pyrinomonadaceae bacterium]